MNYVCKKDTHNCSGVGPDKPLFKCLSPGCSRTFKLWSNIVEHLSTTHYSGSLIKAYNNMLKSRDTIVNGKGNCGLCNQPMKNKNRFLQHLQVVHKLLRPEELDRLISVGRRSI